MAPYKIFIVEDDPWYGGILEYHLSLNPDYSITRFTSGKELLANLHKEPDLITVDFSLPDFSGDKLYQKITATNSQIPVIIISGQEDISTAVNLLKMGVTDYLVKDDNTKDLLWNAVIKIRQTGELKKEVAQLKEELGQKYAFDKSIKGQSPSLQKVFALMEKASRTNINVSITGETGTGKEVVAKAIHYNSDRKRKAFVAVNMAAIPRELIESELFGHEKGAFTGALARKAGKFEEANGGTIFLDEIGNLTAGLQAKLLSALQNRVVTRVGSNQARPIDVRVISATNMPLYDMVKDRSFRQDLLYRINTIEIHLPSLRERAEDILLLSEHFLQVYNRKYNRNISSISSSLKKALLAYPWPGNVRELQHAMERAVIMARDSGSLQPDDFMLGSNPSIDVDALSAASMNLEDMERETILKAIKKHQGNISEASKELGLTRASLYRRLEKYGI